MSDNQNVPTRHVAVRPNLHQLKQHAKDLLHSVRHADPSAIDEFKSFHPEAAELLSGDKNQISLSQAQFVLARTYGVRSWPRLVHACTLIDAIWKDDVEAVRHLILKHPSL